jgi:hypothetical protein
MRGYELKHYYYYFIIIIIINYLKFHTLSDLRCHLDALFLMFSLALNIALPFWKPSAFVCRIEISEILNCFILTLTVANALPLHALRRLMPSARTAVYPIVGLFRLMMCYQVSRCSGFPQYYFDISFPAILFCLFSILFCVLYCFVLYLCWLYNWHLCC